MTMTISEQKKWLKRLERYQITITFTKNELLTNHGIANITDEPERNIYTDEMKTGSIKVNFTYNETVCP